MSCYSCGAPSPTSFCSECVGDICTDIVTVATGVKISLYSFGEEGYRHTPAFFRDEPVSSLDIPLWRNF